MTHYADFYDPTQDQTTKPAPELVQAVVKFAAREPMQTSRGPRINIKATLPDGTDVQVWGAPDSPIATWAKGQRVLLLQKGKYFDPAPNQPNQGQEPAQHGRPVQGPQRPAVDVSTPEGMEALQKRADALTGLYMSIYARLIEGNPEEPFGAGVNKEDLSSAAATIFIQLMK